MRVLSPEGEIIVMLLNSDLAFFQQNHAEGGSYVRNDLHVLELALEEGGARVSLNIFLVLQTSRFFQVVNLRQPHWGRSRGHSISPTSTKIIHNVKRL